MEKLKRFGKKLGNILKLYTTGIFFSYREIEEMKRKYENGINLRTLPHWQEYSMLPKQIPSRRD